MEAAPGTPHPRPRYPRLSLRQKAGLVLEALQAYVPSWRALKGNELNEMVRVARNVLPSPSGEGSEEHLVALRLGRVVGKTLRLLPTDSRCLIRALVVTRMLARRGIPCTLVIGVRKESEFEAHAWVEHEGQPILPPGRYTRLLEL